MITVRRELEYSVKNESKLYRESQVSRAFDKLPENLLVFYGSLQFFFRVVHEQVLYCGCLLQWKQENAGACEWKLP